MKKLVPKLSVNVTPENTTVFSQYSLGHDIVDHNKEIIINNAIESLSVSDKYIFYPHIGELLTILGYVAAVTKDGDTSVRSDAFIIDDSESIPIEIKSPTETTFINNKSIRQALENKVILLSRKFYPTQFETSSLAIGFTYPNDRSGVYDLIDDIYNTYGINIGIISLPDLLSCSWEVVMNGKDFDKNRIKNLRGQFK